ncbi:hypothetical protein JXA85_04930 [Candidatus Woesearchaeota archaeon]|nr:hypothetical protein [Candidatus Woesearchaeota archaeon]
MPRIDISETIKLIDFPDKIWEWLDLLGDVVAASQAEAIYQDKRFIADTPFKKILLCTINKDLSILNTIYFILRCEMIHQASSHVRLFCESLITLKYISLDPNTRSGLFWGYADIEAYEITSAILDWEKYKAKEVHVRRVEALFKTFKEKYKVANPVYSFVDKKKRKRRFINWCNKNIANQASECGPEFKRLYELVYKQMSSYIHGSAWSLRRQISYSRAHYNSDIILNDIATIVRTTLVIWVEWAKFCISTLGWRLHDTILNLPIRLDELDEKHFPQK